MGFFDFLKTAGEDKITEKVEVSPERVNELRQQSISKRIATLGVTAPISVAVNGEVATLKGCAPDQATLEKIVLCAGNQHGIGRVDCQITVAAPAASAAAPAAGQAAAAPSAQAPSTFYTVKSGDTLSKIAKECYGNASRYTVIFEANKPMLSDPDKIYPGQSLRIPPL